MSFKSITFCALLLCPYLLTAAQSKSSQVPLTPVPGTAGEGSKYTGNYYQLRFDWLMSYHFTSALEFVHFQVAEAIEAVGGRNSDYIGVEIKFGW